MYCCAVVDTFSRKIIGWSIDTAADLRLVINVRNTAVKTRKPAARGIVHAVD